MYFFKVVYLSSPQFDILHRKGSIEDNEENSEKVAKFDSVKKEHEKSNCTVEVFSEVQNRSCVFLIFENASDCVDWKQLIKILEK